MKIWIIENDPEIRDLCFQALRAVSTRIVLCEEVRMVQPRPEDVVIMDLHGIAAGRLAANGATVIRMTGDLNAKADLYKPFPMDDLVELVARKVRALALLDD